MACEDIQQGIDDLITEKASWQEELRTAPNKPPIIRMIRELNRRIEEERHKLDICLFGEGATPLATFFTGIASFTIPEPKILGQTLNQIVATDAVAIGLHFNVARTSVQITSFPSLSSRVQETPFGPNVTTVRYQGGGLGTFDKATGRLQIWVNLLFDQSIEIPSPFPFINPTEDSTISLLLTTGTSDSLQGAALDRSTKGLTLVGASTFVEGLLHSNKGLVTLDGTLANLP